MPLGCPMREMQQWQGNFCSWKCVLAWSKSKGDSRVGDRHMWIRLLMKTMCGIPMSKNIQPAPPKECLRCFGGEMDIDTFRSVDDLELVELSGIRKAVVPFEREILMQSGLRVTAEDTNTVTNLDRHNHTQWPTKPSSSKTSRRRPLSWAPSNPCTAARV